MTRLCVRGVSPGAPGVYYCGRACAGWPESPLANPFVLEREADRDRVIGWYWEWLAERVRDDDREVVAALLGLPDDAQLGCWCDLSKRCHVEAVIEFARRLREGV
jgi:hypothetical protein